jgi:hypothetical protein
MLIEAAICAFEEALKMHKEINELDRVRMFYKTFDTGNGAYSIAEQFVNESYLKNMGTPIPVSLGSQKCN